MQHPPSYISNIFNFILISKRVPMGSDDYWLSLVPYILTSLITLFVTVRLRTYLKKRAFFNGLPGPNLHPLFGTIHKFGSREEGLRNMENYLREHKDAKIVRSRRGPFNYLIRLVDPELVGKVLSMNPSQAYKGKGGYSLLSQFLGDGLLLLNHEKWFSRRRLLTPAFHSGIIKSYMSTYNGCVDVLLRKWTERVRDGDGVIDVYRDSTLFTLDVMLRCACSYSSDCQMEDSNNAAKEYISAIFDSSKLTMKQFLHIPYYIPFFFSLTPTGSRWRQVCSKIKGESIKIVKARRQDILSGKETVKTKPDFIDILLTTPDSTGSTLSDADIMDEMNTFLFEGHDTTASGLTWTLYTLGQHPEIQRQCREEIRSVLGERELVEWNDLGSLKFTSLCIKEAMRLYPPVPGISRVLTEDLHVDEYVIPKGTPILIPIFLLHRHPKYWDNPDTYDPSRFYDDKPGGSNFSYIPFSAGHRNCIGQKFAQSEELITIARILTKFEWESVSKEVRRLSELILKPEGGLKIKFTSV